MARITEPGTTPTLRESLEPEIFRLPRTVPAPTPY
jgi:hypothetical protein